MSARPVLALLLACSLLPGCASWFAKREPSLPAYQPVDPASLTVNTRMALAAKAVELAIDEFALQHNDRVPGPDSLVRTLTKNGFLDDNQLPRNPFARDRSPVHVLPALVGDNDPLLTEPAPALTAGDMFDRWQGAAMPGTVLVLLTLDRQKFRVFGVGQYGSRPAIVYGPASLMHPAVRDELKITR